MILKGISGTGGGPGSFGWRVEIRRWLGLVRSGWTVGTRPLEIGAWRLPLRGELILGPRPEPPCTGVRPEVRLRLYRTQRGAPPGRENDGHSNRSRRHELSHVADVPLHLLQARAQ